MIVHSVSFFRNDASGYESERAGEARGIFFINFIRCLVRAHFAVFKDWRLVIHHDDRVTEFPYFDVLRRMCSANMLDLVFMGTSRKLCESMMWRMNPLFSAEYADAEYVVCRDVDSLPMHRDRKMLDEAFAAGAAAHIVHDSESHCGMMGGMSAFNRKKFRERFPGVTSVDQLLSLEKD